MGKSKFKRHNCTELALVMAELTVQMALVFLSRLSLRTVERH